MTIIEPAALVAADIAKRSVDRIAWSPNELARALGLNASTIRARCSNNSCAVLLLTERRIAILDGDWQVLVPWDHREASATSDPRNGLDAIREAFRGRDHLSLREIADCVGLGRRSLYRAHASGELGLPIEPREGVPVEVFKEWLRSRRVRARWEVRS